MGYEVMGVHKFPKDMSAVHLLLERARAQHGMLWITENAGEVCCG